METKEIVLISLKRGTPGRGEIIVYYSGGDYDFWNILQKFIGS